jgi:uncharacterized protein
MTTLRQTLIDKARRHISDRDPSHDFSHALRVLANAETIAMHEGGDLEVIIPAALFHDLVNHPKNHPRSAFSADESAELAGKILSGLAYPQEKISLVKDAISEHSFSKGAMPTSKESMILQDADRLECTGAIAVMRTFCSGGQMRRRFYNFKDPFCLERDPEGMTYCVDFFHTRLMRVSDMMNTRYAKMVAEERTAFLYAFLEQLRSELHESLRHASQLAAT